MPLGVVTPRTIEEAERAIAICRAEGVSVLPRGGGSSQAGQTVNSLARRSTARSISPAFSISMSPAARCRVEPGIVLDDLNRALQAARPVVPGRRLDRLARHHRRHDRQQLLRRPLAALRQHARERASSIDAMLADGSKAHFGPVAADLSDLPANSPLRPLARDLFALGAPRGRRDRGALSQGAAPGRRLQHRRAGAGAERRQPRAHPGRLRRHAGVLDRDRVEAVAAARPPRGRRLPFRQLPRGDGGGAAHRQARADRGRAGRRAP